MISETLYDDYFTGSNLSKNREMTERKLQLIEQVRNENRRNEYKLSCAKQMIYGKKQKQQFTEDASYKQMYDLNTDEMERKEKHFSLKLRFVCAVFLLTFLVLMDITGKPLGNISATTIKESISLDYETMLVSKLQHVFSK